MTLFVSYPSGMPHAPSTRARDLCFSTGFGIWPTLLMPSFLAYPYESARQMRLTPNLRLCPHPCSYSRTHFAPYIHTSASAPLALLLSTICHFVPTKALSPIYPPMVPAKAFIAGAPPPVCPVIPIPNFRLGSKTSFRPHSVNIPHIPNGLTITCGAQFSFNITHHSTMEIVTRSSPDPTVSKFLTPFPSDSNYRSYFRRNRSFPLHDPKRGNV